MRFFISMLVLLALLTFTGCGMQFTHVDHVDHVKHVEHVEHVEHVKHVEHVDTPVIAKKTPPGNAYGHKKKKHLAHKKSNR